MMNALNNPWITLFAFVFFIGLAVASEPYGHKYSKEDRQQMEELLDHVLAPDEHASNAAKLVYLFGEK